MPKKLAFIFVPAFLLAGLAAALGKMGLMPWAGSHFHGLLMLNGFTGGLITAEKVMARADGVRVSAYWLVVVGMLITLAGIEMASVFVAIAGLLLVWDELAHPAAGHRTDSLLHVLAFFCLTMANVKFFRTGFIPDAILFWQGFVVLMILSTRIKKMGASQSYTLLAGLIFYFISLWLPFHLVGQAITGGTLFVLAVWLFVREVRHSKAGSLMYGAAYFWLAVSGASMLLADQILYSFDFMIHSLFLGFLFSMIFLHVSEAILNRVSGQVIDGKPVFWTGLLALGLLIRLAGGDLMESSLARQLGGVLNVVTLLGFFGFVGVKLIKAKRNEG